MAPFSLPEASGPAASVPALRAWLLASLAGLLAATGVRFWHC